MHSTSAAVQPEAKQNTKPTFQHILYQGCGCFSFDCGVVFVVPRTIKCRGGVLACSCLGLSCVLFLSLTLSRSFHRLSTAYSTEAAFCDPAKSNLWERINITGAGPRVDGYMHATDVEGLKIFLQGAHCPFIRPLGSVVFPASVWCLPQPCFVLVSAVTFLPTFWYAVTFCWSLGSADKRRFTSHSDLVSAITFCVVLVFAETEDIYRVFPDWASAVNLGEYGLSRAILERGYSLACLVAQFQVPASVVHCSVEHMSAWWTRFLGFRFWR